VKKRNALEDNNKNGDDQDIEDIEIDIEKIFPNLSKEIKDKMSKSLTINAVRFHDTTSAESNSSELRNPDVIAFLRRCESDAQGHEIIDFLLKRNEISKEQAEGLKIQLKTQGIRSFGPKKEAGYYDDNF